MPSKKYNIDAIVEHLRSLSQEEASPLFYRLPKAVQNKVWKAWQTPVSGDTTYKSQMYQRGPRSTNTKQSWSALTGDNRSALRSEWPNPDDLLRGMSVQPAEEGLDVLLSRKVPSNKGVGWSSPTGTADDLMETLLESRPEPRRSIPWGPTEELGKPPGFGTSPSATVNEAFGPWAEEASGVSGRGVLSKGLNLKALEQMKWLKSLGGGALDILGKAAWPLLALDAGSRIYEGFEPWRRQHTIEDRTARYTNAYNELDAIGDEAQMSDMSELMGHVGRTAERRERVVGQGMQGMAQREQSFLAGLEDQHRATLQSLSIVSQPSMLERMTAEGVI